MAVGGDEEDNDQRGEGGPAQQGCCPAGHVGPVGGTGAVPFEHPDAVGLGGQRHRQQARGAQQPADRLPRVARDDQRAHERAANTGQRGQRPAVVRPRRLAQQRAVSGGEDGVQDAGERGQTKDYPGDSGVHLNPPGWGRRMSGRAGARSSVLGTTAVTVVPRPNSDSTVTVPPTASSRSRMLTSPAPAPERQGLPRIETGPVVRDGEPASALVLAKPHGHAPRARVLGGVLDRLHAAEVQRRLDRRREPYRSNRVDGDRDRTGGDREPQSRHQTFVGQQPRVDPAGQRGERLDRHPRRIGLLSEHARDAFRRP